MGDIQGCFDEYLELLARITPGPSDPLILLGDTVNRGPLSLEMARHLMASGDEIQAVLGNHELHVARTLLRQSAPASSSASWALRMTKKEQREWLEQVLAWPLYRESEDWIALHGGIPPNWTLEEFRGRCSDASTTLQHHPEAALIGGGKMGEITRETLATLTNLRFVDLNGNPVYGHKGPLADAPAELLPWFRHPRTLKREPTIYFGHWAALGVFQETNIHCLDGGCVWGGVLAAWHHETRRLESIESYQAKRA